MKYEYREHIRYPGESLPKLKSNEKIVSSCIQNAGPWNMQTMILIIEKEVPFISRIRK